MSKGDRPTKSEKGARPEPRDARDWIVAPATATGPAAIAVVRLDGPDCWKAASRVWRPGAQGGKGVARVPDGGDRDSALRIRRSAFPAAREEHGRDLPTAHALPTAPCHLPTVPPPARRLTLGRLIDETGSEIDEALVAFFPSPHSYTRNDLVEFHCHGSAAVVSSLIEALLAAGARMARPGEFTERAFFNGRIDLAQAEGVANLVAARTREAGRAALRQIEGGLSGEILSLRDRAIDLAAEIEAGLDFPEDEIPPSDRRRMLDGFAALEASLDSLIATARKGRFLRDGARVAIAGKPNVGKSSLFNALLGMERALVTPHPGTTRDTIEATLDIRGIPVVLIDTAGVRARDAQEIERLGIERTLREVEAADLVLFVLDASAPPDDEDRRLLDALGATPWVAVANKSDLPPAGDAAERISDLVASSRPNTERGQTAIVRVSALRRENLSSLETAVVRELAGDPGCSGEREGAVVVNLRHEERLRAALAAVGRARESFARGESGECAMVDLNESLDSLGEIVRLSLDDAVLSRVFERFCIGK